MDSAPHDEQGALAALRRSAAWDPRNGDDAAALRVPGGLACISTDSTVAGVHAPAGCPPHALGRRAAARALSDLAAMGAAPHAVTCAVLVPAGGWDAASVAVEGVAERAREVGASLVGGDLAASGGGPLTLVVTVVGHRAGRRRSWITRSGARPGHELWVTGQLGAVGAALRAGAQTLPEPPVRHRAGIALSGVASAMLDLSDGLARDLRNLAAASGVGADVDLERLPLAPGASSALDAARDGDDYELLVALPPEREEHARAALALAHPQLAFTKVGHVTDAAGSVRFLRDGSPVDAGGGFAHA